MTATDDDVVAVPPDDRTPVTRPAPTDPLLLPTVRGRWSPRAFDPDRDVDPAVVVRVLEAARWAPSSGNAQPWRYLVFDDTVADARAQARACLKRGNAWARRAPVLALSLVERTWPGGDDRNPSALHDVGAANLALSLQATAEGLITHQMAGFDRTCARESFGLPDHVDPVTFIAIGHPGRVADLDESKQARERAERVRRPLRETVFVGGWQGRPLRDPAHRGRPASANSDA